MKKSTLMIVVTLLVSPAVHAKDRVYSEPLIETRWAQRGPYAEFTPNSERLGCWSVAFAQILYYHRLQPSGQVSYDGKGYAVSEDFRRRFEWHLFAESLSGDTPPETRAEVARYCYYTALAIRKDFVKESAYKGNSDVRRAGVEKHFGCATQRYSDDRDGRRGVERVIISELKRKRPLLLYTEGANGLGHAFVIDGARTSDGRLEVHLNCGWAGADDGWYEFWQPFATSRGLFDSPGRWVLAIRP